MEEPGSAAETASARQRGGSRLRRGCRRSPTARRDAARLCGGRAELTRAAAWWSSQASSRGCLTGPGRGGTGSSSSRELMAAQQLMASSRAETASARRSGFLSGETEKMRDETEMMRYDWERKRSFRLQAKKIRLVTLKKKKRR